VGISIFDITILRFIRKFWANFLVFGVFYLSACTTQNKQIPHPYYHEYPTAQKERITEICDHVAASHFVVEKRVVYFRKAGPKEDINMPHYNTALPDGYYSCSDPLLLKSHLE
jgi:hypothetical protein